MLGTTESLTFFTSTHTHRHTHTHTYRERERERERETERETERECSSIRKSDENFASLKGERSTTSINIRGFISVARLPGLVSFPISHRQDNFLPKFLPFRQGERERESQIARQREEWGRKDSCSLPKDKILETDDNLTADQMAISVLEKSKNHCE